MCKKNKVTMYRILSFCIVCMLMIGMIPVTAFASDPVNPLDTTSEQTEQPSLMFVVKESSENHDSIDSAIIEYEIIVDGAVLNDGSVSTINGDAIIEEINGLGAEIAEGKIIVNYIVSKDGFVSKSDSLAITDKVTTQYVYLDLQKNTFTVSYTKKGNGTVLIDEAENNDLTIEEGTTVAIHAIPEEDYYVYQVKINDEIQPINDYSSFEKNIVVETDVRVNVTFVKKRKVTVLRNEGGTVLLDSENVDSKIVYKNDTVNVSVIPDVGYQISSVSVNETPKKVTNPTEYVGNIKVVNDTEVSVTFVKVFTISLTYDNETGKVISDPACIGGQVTVNEGTDVVITATPNKIYRVSKVTITGKPETEFNDNTYNNSNPYKVTLNADKDYSVDITFAPLVYDIILNNPDNGSISTNVERINYNDSYVLYITPNEGYMVDTVLVNNEDLRSSLTEKEESNELLLVVDNVKDNQNISADFKPISSATKDEFEWNSQDALRVINDTSTYIFAKDKEVVFTTNHQGILLTLEDGSTLGGMNQNSISITNSVTITKIDLHYDYAWHTVEVDSVALGLCIVFDDEISTPILQPEEANQYGYYNKNVNVTVDINDTDNYSGLKEVEYWITSDGTETKRETLYTYNDGDEIQNSIHRIINVDAQSNNSDNVSVYVKATDRAGNEKTSSIDLKINSTNPTIEVSIDGTLHSEAVVGYYNSHRTATITITDRASCFDENAAMDGITISAVDANGKAISTISKAAMVYWSHNGDKHIGTIEFNTDANYTWDISYTNKAGLSNEGKLSEAGESIYKFAVDTVSPTGEIKVENNIWSDLRELLTFRIWKNYTVNVVATAKDVTSPLKEILYYKSNKDEALTKEELVQLYEDGSFTPSMVSVSEDEQFTVYARITDLAGNTIYIGTNGVIVDTTGSEDQITLVPENPNSKGFYNSDVNVSYTVNEEISEGRAYSGIKRIDYKVIANAGTDKEVVTQKGNLYKFEIADPTKSQLEKVQSGVITVNSKKNNYDRVRVLLTVIDNAGNEYSKSTNDLSINITKPTITVSFGNDSANKVDNGNGYFGQNRTAELTIVDRASTFNAETATNGITIEAVDVNGEIVQIDKSSMISDWTNNGDVHTATVLFSKDANYTWSMAYTNNADVENRKINTSGCVTPYKFTVDKIKPTGSIKVDRNEWNELLSILTFGLYKNNKVDVTVTSEDKTSPLTVEYYKTSVPYVLTADVLDQKYKSGEFSNYFGSDVQKNGVSPEEQLSIYLKITDYAGNYSYINSDGYIVDSIASKITITKDAPNKNGLYNKNVNVSIKVDDADPYSGIKTVDYWIEKDNKKTQDGNLYTFAVSNPRQNDLLKEWNGSITIDASLNNSCNVVAFVKTVDNAGNEKTESIPVDIDVTAPKIKIVYNDRSNTGAKEGYYTSRTATVTITERTHHFDETAATKGIMITAVDAKGKAVKDAYSISKWTTSEGSSLDAAVHTAVIKYNKDANYTFAISYTDKADNKAVIDVSGQKTPYKFTVDTTPPEGTVTAESVEGRKEVWSRIVNKLTFGFWSNKKITVSGTSTDITSPIANVLYYMPTSKSATDQTTALTKGQLDNITSWKSFSKIEVQENAQFTVYVKIIDNAGNYTYIGTNGFIVDDQHPIEESVAPEITVKPEQPINGIYKGDVNVSISVNDPMVGGTYSGLKEISYQVFDRGSASPEKATQQGVLYSFSNNNPSQSELLQKWQGSITVNSALNNSNDIQIVIYAVDNAGNAVDNSQKEAQSYTTIKIDTTAPTINISYNNNSADNNKYFKADRIATIVVTERNFKSDDAIIKVIKNGTEIHKTLNWTDVGGTFNQDNSTHTATINYDEDGDYTFSIEYTDLAGNKCTTVNYADGTVSGTEFTVDKTIPVITVTYDNNNALNGNYFKASRKATIVINEHNFSKDRVNVVLNASDNGQNIEISFDGKWIDNGDTHTSTINYQQDALYSFDISCKDMAGNDAEDYKQDKFYVDKTAPEIVITGVSDKSANNGDIIPNITVTDTNFNPDGVNIVLDGANNGKALSYPKSISDITNGQTIIYENFKVEKSFDDIYTLNISLSDFAGNETTKSITFSANRFGSVYNMESVKPINNKYLKEGQDIVFVETNVDSLDMGKTRVVLTKNGTPTDLVEGKDYTVSKKGGDGQWSQYQYTVNKELFADDGTYSISIYSVDSAGNINENIDEAKDAEISFGIDKTDPVVIPVDIESGKQYAVESKSVTVDIKDNLVLETVKIYLNDEEITYTVEGETYSFDIPQSNNLQSLKIMAVDSAGNETETSIDNFLISTNIFVRWFNNTPLFIGSIVVFCAIVVGAIVLIVTVRKKKKR